MVAIAPPNTSCVVVVEAPNKALNASVTLPPITTLDLPAIKLTSVPETVMAEAPSFNVCEPPTTNSGAASVEKNAPRGWVLPSTMMDDPPDGKERMVPETVMAGPPGARVWEPIINNGAPGVMLGLRTSVLPPIMIAVLPGSSETMVPDAVICPPGVKICVPMIIADDGSWVKVESPTVITTGVETCAGEVSPGSPFGVVPSAGDVIGVVPCVGLL